MPDQPDGSMADALRRSSDQVSELLRQRQDWTRDAVAQERARIRGEITAEPFLPDGANERARTLAIVAGFAPPGPPPVGSLDRPDGHDFNLRCSYCLEEPFDVEDPDGPCPEHDAE